MLLTVYFYYCCCCWCLLSSLQSVMLHTHSVLYALHVPDCMLPCPLSLSMSVYFVLVGIAVANTNSTALSVLCCWVIADHLCWVASAVSLMPQEMLAEGRRMGDVVLRNTVTIAIIVPFSIGLHNTIPCVLVLRIFFLVQLLKAIH